MTISVDPAAVKRESEAAIRSAGGRTCDWLPPLDAADLRPLQQIIGRALVMNAMLNIYFGAPTVVVKAWIDQHGLTEHLSVRESEVLRLRNEDIPRQQSLDLFWYIEALWALMWIGSLIDRLPFQEHVEDRMASMCPNLQEGEGPQKFAKKMRSRSDDEVFRMLDLYYRVHWWTCDGRLQGYSTEPANLDIVMERRRALEWAMDPTCDWDDVPLDT